MSKFSKSLKEHIDESDLSIKEVAEKLGINRTHVYKFLNEKCTPNFETFVNLLYIFNCSAEALLGREDFPKEEVLHPVPPFQERLRALLKEKNYSQAYVIKNLPVSSSLMYKWISGKSKPYINMLIKLSQFFDCSVDYLIGRIT